MYIIAGLGNPTKEYEGTRHNVGFDVIDRLSERYNIDVTMEKHRALIGKGMIAGQKVILVKPQTYMNLSGESIRSVIDYYKVDPEKELIVIYDDISLGVGQLRIRAKGSAGAQHQRRPAFPHHDLCARRHCAPIWTPRAGAKTHPGAAGRVRCQGRPGPPDHLGQAGRCRGGAPSRHIGGLSAAGGAPPHL